MTKRLTKGCIGCLLLLVMSLSGERGRPLEVVGGWEAAEPRRGTAERLPAGMEPSDWERIQAAHEEWKHRIQGAAEGGVEWRAANPGTGLRASFGERGAEVRPEAGDWRWGLELVSYGIGAVQQSMEERRPKVWVTGQRIGYQWDGNLEEWYQNEPEGLEHGFTIQERPGRRGEEGALELRVRVKGGWKQIEVIDEGRGVAFGRQRGEALVRYCGLTVIDAEGRQMVAKLAREEEGLRLVVEEQSASYPLTIDPIISQQAYLKPSNAEAGDQFGSSVAISGETVVVGALGEDSSAMGSPGDNSALDAGAAYVFVRSGVTWSQQAYLKASNAEAGDLFGRSVAISGETVVIGAWGESSSATGGPSDNSASRAGAAYVFVRSGTMWSQQAYLKAGNAEAGDQFGLTVAISGETVVVGARGESSSAMGGPSDNSAPRAGAAYVFVRSGTMWSQQAYLKAGNAEAGDQFGYSVAISGETVVVTANGEDGSAMGGPSDNSTLDAGAAYIFVKSGTMWSQQAYLKAGNAENEDGFGTSVAICGETVVVGAQGESSSATGGPSDNSASQAGAAYVFVRSGTMWSQQAYLKAGNAEDGDRFGTSVAISGEIVVVGAFHESSSITGGPSDNSAPRAGAAYLFFRSGTTWNEWTYLKAGNAEAGDQFGHSVAISGLTMVVSAPLENGNATGDPADNSASDAGATYAYLLNAPPTILVASGVTRIAGSVRSSSTIAIVSDVETAAGNLMVSVTGPTLSNGVTISSLSNTAGTVRANLAAAHNATSATFTLQVSDGTTTVTAVLLVTINTLLAGPGVTPVAGSRSQSLPGSLLIYNLYTSGVNSAVNDTRITLTNTHPAFPVSVRLFFIDGSNCSTADLSLRLTQNQTVSLLASEFDPEVTGYLIAIATDPDGCPLIWNDLVGETYVKFESGHRANLAAIGVEGMQPSTPLCGSGAPTTVLHLDGVSYAQLPRTLAIDNLPSSANGNSTMLIVNRIGGDLSVGASRFGTIFGLLFDDVESAQSFVLGGGECQLRGVLGNNFPRTVPRYSTVIPAGRTGWMKFWTKEEEALTGAVINESSLGFSGGHNLHALTTTAAASLTMPVFPQS